MTTATINTVLKLQSRGTITIPKKIREVLGLEDGDILNAVLEDEKIIIKQASKFDTELQEDILESLEDIKNGDYIIFSSVDEMHKKLKSNKR